jgi:hypothetical protein
MLTAKVVLYSVLVAVNLAAIIAWIAIATRHNPPGFRHRAP